VNDKTQVVPQPPYSPSLSPADFFLFRKLKVSLKERRFEPVEKIKNTIAADANFLFSKSHVECHEKWKRRWNRIDAVGAISKGIVFNKMYLEYNVLYLTSPTVLLLNTEVQTNGLTSNA